MSKLLYNTITLFAMLSCFSASLGAQESISLNRLTWKYNTQDSNLFILRETDDSNWKYFKPDSSIYTADTQVLWLRTKVFIRPPLSQGRLALLLEKICGVEQIYLNGRLVNQSAGETKFYSRCMRSAIHPLPLNGSSSQEDESTIAIRLLRSSKVRPPSLQDRMVILPLQKAELYLWKNNFWGLAYGLLCFVLALFFLAAYLKLYRVKEYYAFSAFLFTYALYKTTQNELLYTIVDLAPLYERISLAAFIMLPAFFYLFYTRFFSIKSVQLSLGVYTLNKDAHKLGSLYLSLSAVVAMLAVISPNFSEYFKANTVWLFLQFPVFIYYLYTAVQKLKNSLRESTSFLVGGLILSFVFLYDLVAQRGNGLFSVYGGGGLFGLQLSLSIGLLYSVVLRSRETKKYSRYLKSIDELQQRIFGYIGSLLAKPTLEVIDLIQKWRELKRNKKDSTNQRHQAANIAKSIKDIQNNLNDLMELAQLEILSEPEHVEEINLQDFIQTILAHSKLSSHIRVDPDEIIETNPALMNSSMIYLTDLLDQQGFENTDLTVTTQPGGKLLFYFLSFHPESAQVREFYRVYSHQTPLRDPRRIKWSIIAEIVRVLQGKLSISQIRGRFLRVSIMLPRTLRTFESSNDQEKMETKKQEVRLVFTQQKQKTEESHEKRARAPENERAIATPRFRANMSIGELIALLKAKRKRSNSRKRFKTW